MALLEEEFQQIEAKADSAQVGLQIMTVVVYVNVAFECRRISSTNSMRYQRKRLRRRPPDFLWAYE